jgi:hypothetical protein
MNELLTAEEILKLNFYNGSYVELYSGDFEDVRHIMIQFAIMHCTKQLELILENIIIDGNKHEYELDTNSIINAYPLTNIK